MSRVKRGVTTHARHRKVILQSKGFRGVPVPAIALHCNDLKNHYSLRIGIVAIKEGI